MEACAVGPHWHTHNKCARPPTGVPRGGATRTSYRSRLRVSLSDDAASRKSVMQSV